MARVTLGIIAAIAVTCGLVFGGKHYAGSLNLTSAPMLAWQAPQMAACKSIDASNGAKSNVNLAAAGKTKGAVLIAVGDTLAGGGTAVAIGEAVVGTGRTEAAPFWVQSEAELSTQTTQGGCRCGTAVCTVGRICYAASNMCFLPPCPISGISDGDEKVPAIYTAGCWCADMDEFDPLQAKTGSPGTAVAFTTQITKSGSNTLKGIPFFPTSAMGNSATARICVPGTYCYADIGSPQCLAKPRSTR